MVELQLHLPTRLHCVPLNRLKQGHICKGHKSHILPPVYCIHILRLFITLRVHADPHRAVCNTQIRNVISDTDVTGPKRVQRANIGCQYLCCPQVAAA
jgi:hypothetical protein